MRIYNRFWRRRVTQAGILLLPITLPAGRLRSLWREAMTRAGGDNDAEVAAFYRRMWAQRLPGEEDDDLA